MVCAVVSTATGPGFDTRLRLVFFSWNMQVIYCNVAIGDQKMIFKSIEFAFTMYKYSYCLSF